MANEARKSENAKSGTLTPGNSLTNSGTTMVSSNLAQVMVIGATEHYPIVLDPLGTANGPEVVWITAHSAASTGATIVRGREGTTGVSHTSTTAWVHGATVSDYIQKVTAATHPSTGGLPFAGQTIFETDTGSLLVYYNSTVGWVPPWNMPWGVIDIASVTADSGGFTAITDYLAGADLPASWPANRRVRVSAHTTMKAAGAASQVEAVLREGSTELGLDTDTCNATGHTSSLNPVAYLTPTAGAHSYKLSGRANTNAIFTASATPSGANTPGPTWLVVEDVGPATVLSI